jgi:hypothetical protein
MRVVVRTHGKALADVAAAHKWTRMVYIMPTCREVLGGSDLQNYEAALAQKVCSASPRQPNENGGF